MNCLSSTKNGSVKPQPKPAINHHNQVRKNLLSWCFFLLPISLISPAIAAERIYINYSAFERSISVEALEKYAKTGEMDENLAAYAPYLTPAQLQQVRQILVSRADLNAVAISQFLYTAQGEILLKRLGQVIQSQARQPGSHAIRAALILAAASPEGLTPLNTLRKFPTQGMRIDVGKALALVGDLSNLINQTNRAIAGLEKIAATEVALAPGLANLPDPGENGPYLWKKETLTLTDHNRQMPGTSSGARVFPVDIYMPQLNAQETAPILVISHGLGSSRITFSYLAQHLASYGFAVAVPQHPGSDAKQIEALAAGRASELTQPSEFIDRPLDIKYLIDELTRWNQSNPLFQNKLNLDKIGVIGQSFGGYTALALAGAKLNFDYLQKVCLLEDQSWNLSLLLQCRALELPPEQYNLQDERVKAIFVINPMNGSLF